MLGASHVSTLLSALQRKDLLASREWKVTADVDLLDAIYFVATAEWKAARFAGSRAFVPRVAVARNQVLQRARNADLPIWGRAQSSEGLELISAHYWRRFEVDYFKVLAADRANFTTQPTPRNRWGGETYRDMMTSKVIVEKLWPKRRPRP
jgi:hypothetical protein